MDRSHSVQGIDQRRIHVQRTRVGAASGFPVALYERDVACRGLDFRGLRKRLEQRSEGLRGTDGIALSNEHANQQQPRQRLIGSDRHRVAGERQGAFHVASTEIDPSQLNLGTARVGGSGRRLLEHRERFICLPLFDEGGAQHVHRLEPLGRRLQCDARRGLGFPRFLVSKQEPGKHRVEIGAHRRLLDRVRQPAICERRALGFVVSVSDPRHGRSEDVRLAGERLVDLDGVVEPARTHIEVTEGKPKGGFCREFGDQLDEMSFRLLVAAFHEIEDRQIAADHVLRGIDR